MTKLLEKALAEVAKLRDEDQDFIAQIILDELADEEGWRRRFAESQDLLERMGQEALEAHRRGETTPLDFDRRK